MPGIAKTKLPTADEQRAAIAALTQQVAAELIGKQASYLRNHSDWIPRQPNGRYSARDLVAAFLGRESGERAESRADIALDKRRREAEARKLEEQADKAAFENEMARGEWMRADDVVAMVSAILAAYSHRFLTLHREVAPEMSEEVAKSVCPKIERQVLRLLKALQEELQRCVPETVKE